MQTFAWKQRKAYHEGNLSQEQIALFEQIPWWHWNLTKWDQRFDQLQGRNRPPHATEEKTLYTWWDDQLRRHKAGKLSEDQIKKLETLPFWEEGGVKNATWERRYAELAHRMERPSSTKEPRLYEWWRNQLSRCENDALMPEQLQKLESLPFWPFQATAK